MRTKERKCVQTGEVADTSKLVRFVVGPDKTLVPDLVGKLPGRGIWVTASRDILDAAIAKKTLQRQAARVEKGVIVPDGLCELVEQLLAQRILSLLGLERKSGRLVLGFEKVKAALSSGEAVVLMEAYDGSEGGRSKLRPGAQELTTIDLFGRDELSIALGRANAVHGVILDGGNWQKLLAEVGRLRGFRTIS